jgi:hypothetical protein
MIVAFCGEPLSLIPNNEVYLLFPVKFKVIVGFNPLPDVLQFGLAGGLQVGEGSDAFSGYTQFQINTANPKQDTFYLEIENFNVDHIIQYILGYTPPSFANLITIQMAYVNYNPNNIGPQNLNGNAASPSSLVVSESGMSILLMRLCN